MEFKYMKISKSKVSIVTLSIFFFITSTEILKALHFDAKVPEAHEVNKSREENKNHDAKGKDIANEHGQHEIPKAEQHKANEAERQKKESKNTSENRNNTYTLEKIEANQNKGKENQTGIFDLSLESRPSSPNEFTQNKSIKNSIQKDTAVAEQTSKNLDEAPKDSNNLFKKEEKIEKKVEEEQNLFKEKEIKLEENNGSSKEKALVDKEIENTNQKKNIISKMVESFQKLFETITRYINEDLNLSAKERQNLKDTMSLNKAKLQQLSKQLKALGDNPSVEEITKIEKEIDYLKNDTALILRDTNLNTTIYKDISKAIDDLGEEMAADIKNRVNENPKKVKDLKEKRNTLSDRIDKMLKGYEAQTGIKYDILKPGTEPAPDPYTAELRKLLLEEKQLNNEIINLKVRGIYKPLTRISPRTMYSYGPY